MSRLLVVCRDEWRLWRRSRLARVVVVLALALSLVAVVLGVLGQDERRQQRLALQAAAEQTFVSQPDRHPHRMVHYGHYLFRPAALLSVVDPGVDSYTGNVMFMEAHRQNTPMFAGQGELGSPSLFGELTPALLLQTAVPLVLVLLGAASMTREYESNTANQLRLLGVGSGLLLLGKFAALAAAAGLLLLPLLGGVLWVAVQGESLALALLFWLGYAMYLLIWCGLIVGVSACSRQRVLSLGVLLLLWLLLLVLLPRFATELAARSHPLSGKVAADLAMAEALAAAGDGHNAADPAFDQLRRNLLDQYQVERIEDLPVNFRGVTAGYAEARLTAVMNEFAERQMQTEIAQAEAQRSLGWLTPALALREFSMALAGTDLETHHRFLREAEAARFEFVQELNTVHEQQLSYADDINRGIDAASERRARVSAANWRQVLDEFEFEAAPPSARMEAAMPALRRLTAWLAVLALVALGVFNSSRRRGGWRPMEDSVDAARAGA